VYNSAILVGQDHLQERMQAYRQVLGEQNVTVVDAPEQVPATPSLIDLWGTAEQRSSIAHWCKHGAFVIAAGLPAPTVAESRALLAGGQVLLARPSRYDPRFVLLRRQLQEGQVGRLVAARLVRAWPDDGWLPAGVVPDYAPDALEAMASLMGSLVRIMAREQQLARTVPDTLFAVLVGQNEAIGYLELSNAYPAGYSTERIEVVGDQGMIEYNADVNRTLRVAVPGHSWLRDAFQEPPLLRMVRAYVHCANHPETMSAEIAAGLACLDLVERVQQSARANRPA
jgi:predicted dehydrogenase